MASADRPTPSLKIYTPMQFVHRAIQDVVLEAQRRFPAVVLTGNRACNAQPENSREGRARAS
jgi:hypothetical protein